MKKIEIILTILWIFSFAYSYFYIGILKGMIFSTYVDTLVFVWMLGYPLFVILLFLFKNKEGE